MKAKTRNFKPKHAPQKIDVRPKYREMGQAALMVGGRTGAHEVTKEVIVPAAESV